MILADAEPEDRAHLLTAMEFSERLRRGEETTVPWSVVRSELGLDG